MKFLILIIIVLLINLIFFIDILIINFANAQVSRESIENKIHNINKSLTDTLTNLSISNSLNETTKRNLIFAMIESQND